MCVCVYIYMAESLCCTPETNTTLSINYTPIKKLEYPNGNMDFFKQ